WPARCALRGAIVRSPILRGDAFVADVDVDFAACDGARPTHDESVVGARISVHVPRDGAPPLARGDRVAVVATLAPPYRFWNDGDPRPGQAHRGALLTGGAQEVVVLAEGRGIGAWIDRARDRVRRRIAATFPAESSGMARALVLGEDDLTPDDTRAFRRSGLAHLLAVSGMHLVLVVAGIVMALRALLVRVPPIAERIEAGRVAAAIGVPLAWIYADFAGASGSAVRAAWMTTVGLLAHVLARRPAPWRALGLSILAMAIADPLAAFDLSFVLSAAATLGILAIGPRVDARMRAALPAAAAVLARPLAATIGATVACAPILAGMASDLPVAGLFANLLAVPIGDAAALPLCLLHALLAPSPLLERGCALAAAGALDVVRIIARSFAAIPFGAAPVPPPTPWQLAAIALGAVALALRRRGWALAMLAGVIALELDARASGAPRGVLRVTFLDVGQGDAALVDLPDGSAMLIDGGGLVGSPVDVGERAIAPLLRARRRRALAAVVLSHPHPDHFGGLVRGLDGVRADSFWDTGQGEAENTAGPYAEILARMRTNGVRVVRPGEACGTHAIGGALVDVLAPCPAASPDDGPNDNSYVVRVRYGDRAILFAGDAERHEEATLLASRDALRADVLKVGHHGSRTSSTPAFLEAVAPRVAVISCGVRNRFGHPHASTLVALAAAGARVYRTDRDGAVVVTTDGRSLDVATEAP
ncbi:MAG TPA: DNA internalization-related competence protein ComEC/Rec2, partial [Labilithrix sp.]